MIVSTVKNRRKKPCKECPFKRENTLEGEKPGGSSPEVYIGQAQGPFWLPCHMDPAYKDKKSDPTCVDQCAGAAIFRANVEGQLRYKLPEQLMFLQKDTALVFASFEEFYAHYKNISRQEAKKILTPDKLEELLIAEYYEWKNLNQ
jgi:hypothetical protein